MAVMISCYKQHVGSNLLGGGGKPSLDTGFNGAEIAMAAYCSSSNLLLTPSQSMSKVSVKHNKDVST
ncbi:unnamed protein product [Ilex paraguariensis]|uniref:Uncharacterized protein n=1 Tax=Ilex paraguariensis TaxID=185542 RepID=A0ABC8RJZ6_9AQUA